MIKLSYADYSDDLNYKSFNFPVGEWNVQVEYNDKIRFTGVNILYEYDGDASIIQLLLIVDAIRRVGGNINELTIPYVPFSRQDRVCNRGEPHSLRVFCQLINNLKAASVIVTDPHSNVVEALLDNCHVVHQWEVFTDVIKDRFISGYWLASPDAGASKKIYELAKRVNTLGVLECGKQRCVADGRITGVTLPLNFAQVKDDHKIIMADDIADNGNSFIYLAKAMREAGFAGKLVLMVTHGFFNQGLSRFVDIDEVYSRKERLK